MIQLSLFAPERPQPIDCSIAGNGRVVKTVLEACRCGETVAVLYRGASPIARWEVREDRPHRCPALKMPPRRDYLLCVCGTPCVEVGGVRYETKEHRVHHCPARLR